MRMYLIYIDNFSQSTTSYMLKDESYKEYLSKVLAVFNQVYRVCRRIGTLFIKHYMDVTGYDSTTLLSCFYFLISALTIDMSIR